VQFLGNSTVGVGKLGLSHPWGKGKPEDERTRNFGCRFQATGQCSQKLDHLLRRYARAPGERGYAHGFDVGGYVSRALGDR